MKFPFLVLLLFSSVFCFSQKEPIIIYDGTPDDSLEFEGSAINLHIELLFIKKIIGEDTVYYDFNELENVYFSCARYVNDTGLYYYPENNYVVLEIDYNDFCLITFYTKVIC